MRKFQVRISFIKFLKRPLKFLLAVSPHKNHVINISTPDHRFTFLTFKETSFYFIHMYYIYMLNIYVCINRYNNGYNKCESTFLRWCPFVHLVHLLAYSTLPFKIHLTAMFFDSDLRFD